MLKLIRKLIWSHLKNRKGRLFLTLFGIMLGVAIFVSIGIVNRSVMDSYNGLVDEMAGKASLQVVNYTNSGFSENLLEKVEELEDIEVAAPLVKTYSQVQVGDKNSSLLVYGVDWDREHLVREYEVNGKGFDNRENNEIMLTEKLAKELDIGLGETVSLLTNQGFVDYEVIGLISEAGAGRTNLGMYAAIPLYSAQEAFGKEGKLDVIDLVLDRETDLEVVKEEVAGVVGNSAIVQTPSARGQDVENVLAGIQYLLSLSGMIALLVGLFLVYNNMSISVEERKKEIALLRSLGMTRKGVLKVILIEAGLLGLVGSLLGFILGVLLAGTLSQGLSATALSLWRFTPITNVQLSDLIFAVIIGVIAAVVATYFPASNAMKISPIEAFRDPMLQANQKEKEQKKLNIWGIILLTVGTIIMLSLMIPELNVPKVEIFGTIGLILQIIGLVILLPSMVAKLTSLGVIILKPFFGIKGEMAAKNLTRNRSRTAATISALAIAVTMLVSFSAMSVSYKQEIRNWVDKSIGWDMLVTSSWFGTGSDVGLSEEMLTQISKIDGVDLVSPERLTSIILPKENISLGLQVFEMDDFVKFSSFNIVEGPSNEELIEEIGKGNIAISTQTSSYLGLKVGDMLSLPTQNGEKKFKVVGIVSDFSTGLGNIYIDRDEYIKYWNDDRIDSLAVKVNGDADVDEIAREIEELWGKSHNLSVQTNSEFREETDKLAAESFALSDSLVLLALLVGALGVMNTMLITVFERKREFGVFRAIGAQKRDVYWILMGESLMIGLAGVLLGVLLGSLAGKGIVLATYQSTGLKLGFVFPIDAVSKALLVGLILVPLAALLPARVSNKQNLSESISYE